jgi:hypothetical protein
MARKCVQNIEFSTETQDLKKDTGFYRKGRKTMFWILFYFRKIKLLKLKTKNKKVVHTQRAICRWNNNHFRYLFGFNKTKKTFLKFDNSVSQQMAVSRYYFFFLSIFRIH